MGAGGRLRGVTGPPGGRAGEPFNRPASFACHYLAVADFAPVELSVGTLRSARTACSQRVTMTQGERPILEAMVWSVGPVEGSSTTWSSRPTCRVPTTWPRSRKWPPDGAALRILGQL